MVTSTSMLLPKPLTGSLNLLSGNSKMHKHAHTGTHTQARTHKHAHTGTHTQARTHLQNAVLISTR